MKILHITKGFKPDRGGIETYTYYLVKGVNKKHKVKVIATMAKTSKREVVEGIEVVRIKKIFDFFQAPVMLPFYEEIFNFNPDLIHFHIPNPIAEIYLLLYFLIKGKKEKVVVTYHADLPEYTLLHKFLSFLRLMYLFLFLKLVDKIIATSPDYMKGSRVLKKYRDRVVVIPIGIDRRLPTVSTKKLKRKFNIKKEKIILFVGRLFPYKGLEYLIKAMKEITKKLKNVKLVIVGSGMLESKLKKMVKELGIESQVIFCGELKEEEKNTFYKICDIFVLPSINRGEAFGVVLLEAMAFGKPIITTRIYGSGVNFVSRGVALRVQPRDSYALKTSILSLLTNKKLRRRIGKKGKEKFLKMFTQEKMVRKVIKVYERVFRNFKEKTG